MEVTCEFEFEELNPVVNDRLFKGVMLYGTATLVSADPESDPHSFYVRSIELDGGVVLVKGGGIPNGHHSFEKDLFKAIADIIQNDRHPIGRAAQANFGEAVDESRQPDPDAWRDQRQDNRMWGHH